VFPRSLPAVLILAWAAAAAPRAAGAQSIDGAHGRTTALQRAPLAEAVEAAQELTRLRVRLEGGAGRLVTVTLRPGALWSVMDELARAAQGSWKLRLTVLPGEADAPAGSRGGLDQLMAVGFQDLPADRAWAIVARELGAELDLRCEAKSPITLLAVNVPAERILDGLARQSGAHWSAEVVLKAPDVPPVRRAFRRDDGPGPPPMQLLMPLTVVPMMAEPSAGQPVGGQEAGSRHLERQLRSMLRSLVTAPPRERPLMILAFLEDGERLLAPLQTLNQAERAARVRSLIPLLSQWNRLYRGLAPDVERELAPVTAFLEFHLRP
jgi:hypothetical protein